MPILPLHIDMIQILKLREFVFSFNKVIRLLKTQIIQKLFPSNKIFIPNIKYFIRIPKIFSFDLWSVYIGNIKIRNG